MNTHEITEFATMKADIHTLKKDVSSIKTDLGRFIDKVDDKYATKNQAVNIEKKLNGLESKVDTNTNKITDIGLRLANVAAWVAVLSKLIGVW